MVRNTNSRIAVILLTLIVSAPSVMAHHSFAMFDATREVVVEGTVKQFDFTNPHSWLHMEVIGEDGEAQLWQVEMAAVSVLGRMGWKRNSIVPGDGVTVALHPLHSGEHGGNMVKITYTETGEEVAGPGR